LVLGFGLLLLFCARPALRLLTAAWNDRNELQPAVPGQVDDASRLNQTSVAEIVDLQVDVDRAEVQLAELLQRARRDGLRVSIAGARHSMGGHTVYPGGISINMLPLNAMELDTEREILHVGAGALWSDIIPFLDRAGRSVSVMQSNSSFSVGGSLSVNCHDWQFLRYADRPMLSLVMLFNQKRTAEGETEMRQMTRQLVDAALQVGGRYYLPYRLHATVAQFHAAYPMASEFFVLKRRHDPDGLFQNEFFLKYGGRSDVGSQTN
jgi:FAD/FMN-containing dehydrogenase